MVCRCRKDGTICRRCASGRVFVVEASGYFSRPGPRLAAGMEILAAALHEREQKRVMPFESRELISRVASANS